VDDFLALGKSDAEIEEVLEEVSHKINLQDLGEVSTFLGIEFSLQRKKPGPKKGPSDSTSSSSDSEKGYSSLKLHQTRYVYHMLKRFGKEHLIPVNTPTTKGIKLQKARIAPSKEDLLCYQQQTGSLLFLSTKTRPDIAFAVGNCARFMSKPDKSHFTALDRIWKYLIRYPDLGLFLSHESDLGLMGYYDTDWANHLVNRKSTSGYCFLYNRNLIS